MDEKVPPNKKIDLDTILIEEIGQFGKFQLKTFLVTVVLTIFIAWTSTEYLFTTARTNTRCVIPECDGDQPEWSPYWLSNAVPAAGNSFDNCQRFGNTSALPRVVDSATCPSRLFDRDTLQDCDSYVYQDTDSIAYEFNLACNEWARTLIGTIRTLGIIAGFPLAGYVSDRWGRRLTLSVTAFNAAWLGITRYWATTYIGFTVSEFMEAALSSGCYTSAYVLLLELVGPKYRVAAGATLNSSFAAGTMLMALIAWALPYWRHLTLALYIPQLLTLSYYFLMSESVRWYMSKGRFDESEALLRKAAKCNGRHLSEQSLEALRKNAEESRKKTTVLEEGVDQEWLVVTVFKHKRVLLRCLVAPVWWITSTFIYYGLSINAVNMSGNRYLNYIAVSAAEIPGFWISVFLLSRIGRKPVLIIAFWLCAACQIAYIFLPQDMYALSLTVYVIAKVSIAMEVVAIYIYTAELYPTVKRQSLFNFTSMVGRIGSVVAPLTPAIGAQWFEELPFVLFAFMGLLSGALIFLTPETKGARLPDTFEQAEALGRQDSSS